MRRLHQGLAPWKRDGADATVRRTVEWRRSFRLHQNQRAQFGYRSFQSRNPLCQSSTRRSSSTKIRLYHTLYCGVCFWVLPQHRRNLAEKLVVVL